MGTESLVQIKRRDVRCLDAWTPRAREDFRPFFVKEDAN
jgi:hypothetical protein